MLSTPPAFILSQDQTLNKMVSKQLSLNKSSYWNLIISFKEIYSLVKQLALLSPTSLLPYSPGGRAQQFSFWCFSLCSLFNLQGAAAFSLKGKGFVSLLQVPPFVKDFFYPFSHRSSLAVLPPRLTPPATALVEYHRSPLLSTLFLHTLNFLFFIL